MLVFRRLRGPEMSDAQEDAEVAGVLQAVAALRAAERVSTAANRARSHAGWRRWAVAAGLTLAALAIPADRNGADGKGGRSGALLAARPAAAPTAFNNPAVVPAALSGGELLPTIEGINRPGARVYHMDGDGLSATMIVDENLDV
jgi:hypothetical protein